MSESEIEEQLILIDDEAGIDELESYLEDFEYVAYDTETTGLDLDAEVIGFSVAAEVNLGFYVLLAYWDKEAKQLVWLPIKDRARRFLEKLKAKALIMHNGIVDVNWTMVNFGVHLMNAFHTDTMVLAHVTDENRPSYGLKELSFMAFGADAKKEQAEMKDSVIANGGIWESKRGGNKEMFKADAEIIAKYGAKDTILTLRLFYLYIPELFEQNLEKFFYEDESMPLFKTATYQLNTTGLKIDVAAIKKLEGDLEVETARLKAEILADITPYVQERYPGTSEVKTFNIGSGQQLAWLLFFRLGNDWKKTTKAGREKAKELLDGKSPYTPSARRQFVKALQDLGIKPEKYIQCDKKALMNLAYKYTWVTKLLEYKKAKTILKTYAKGMQRFIKYGVIHPSFKQTGTSSGRYSSSQPNFQNLPRDDRRVKSCVIARPGKVFVGADYSQLEPRTFTSQSQDPILMAGFKNKEDFYSVVGIPVFGKTGCSARKFEDTGDPNCFDKKYKPLRQIAKVIALSLAYGTTPYKLSDELRDEQGRNLSVESCTKIRDDYFEKYEGVKRFVDESHLQIVNNGVVYNQFGRPRRIKEAKRLKAFGFPKSCTASELPYQWRSLLNLSVNHRVQSTAASIVNRACIAFCREVVERAKLDPLWAQVLIVLQVHDEVIVECPEAIGQAVAILLKDKMENTTLLDGVDLIAEPKIAKSYAELK